VRFLLVLDVEDLPFLLKGAYELLTLFLRHQELPAVFLSLLLDLHLAYQVVLVFNLIFDGRQVLRRLSIGSLLEEVLVLLAGQFRCC